MIDEKISAVSDLFDDYKYGVASELRAIYEKLDGEAVTEDLAEEVLYEIKMLIDDIERGRI